MEPLLDIRNLSVSYGGATALAGVSLSAREGTMCVIVGESGSGKSTVLKATLRALGADGAITAGSISYRGRDLAGLGPAELAPHLGPRIGSVLQNPSMAFSPVRTVGSQMLETLAANGVEPAGGAEPFLCGLLGRFGFERPEAVLASYPFELSGGMCQRASIALALSLSPDLLLADEPTSALDVINQVQVVDLLRGLCDELGTTVVMVTHNMGVAFRVADDIYVMHDGQVVESGPREQIHRHATHPYTRRLIASIPTFSVEGDADGRGVDGADNSVDARGGTL